MYQLAPRAALKTAPRYLAALTTILLLAGIAAAQTTSAVDGKTPAGLAPGSPAGSYALSGFETVNLFNGSLNFRLPLIKVGGRGGAGYAVTLPVEQKWIVKAGQPSPSGVVPMAPNPNWWQGIRAGYGPGVMHGRRGNHEDSQAYGSIELRTLTRLTFTASDGTEYELRDQKSGGDPQATTWYQQTGNHEGYSRGKVFVTADGSSATFLSDAEIKDYVAPSLTQTQRLFYPTGYLLLADGTRYRVDSGTVSWLRDRNGNRVTFTYGAGSRVATAIDSLGRQVTFTYDNGVRHYDEIGFSGFGGQPRTVRVWYDTLASRLRPSSGYSLQTYHQLFALNSASTTTQYNPTNKVAAVELPDGRRYELYYNPYGELARVELPTGGAVEYDWGGEVDTTEGVIFRHVTKRRVYPAGGTAWVSQTEYVRVSDGTVEERTTDATGALLARAMHYFHGDAYQSMSEDPARPSAISYGKWKEGREYRTEAFDVVNGAAVLRRVVARTWRQPSAGATWPFTGQGETDEAAKPNVPQVTEEVTTLSDSGQVSKRAFAYDRYGNVTDAWEYDFGAVAAGALVRRTHTDYLTTNAVGGTTYDYACDPTTTCSNTSINANVIHLRNLIAQEWVSADGTNRESLTAYAYDQSALTDRANITGLCTTYSGAQCFSTNPTAYATRGNPTAVTQYADAAAATGALITALSYDVAGNVTGKTDPKGHTSYTSYADSFCNDGGARCGGSYTANTYAFASGATSPVPDVSAAFGHAAGTFGSTAALTTSAVYDFYTGLTYSTTDANAKTTKFEYNDPLNRPTAQVRPDGGRTDVLYNDAVGDLYVRVLTDLDPARRTQTRQYYDGFGRPYRSATYENHDTPNPWLTTDTQYDALGRVVKSSLAYRGPGGATPLTATQWSNAGRAETEYDALGRVKKVTTQPDTAAVTTSYDGNRVTVTEQTGRSRKSVTDALGRLREVYEDPSGYNYLTAYAYDALGNLRTVTQGTTQPARVFAYDSLSRLTSATNPETGAVGYAYDGNGNLHTRTDARGVTAIYEYDRLNRNIITSYANDPSGTPAALRRYDHGVNGKGRPYLTEQSGSTTSATYFDQYDALGRIRVRRQKFETAGVWSADFTLTNVYDLAGNVVTQTYPSGRAVTYSYDGVGRPGDNNGQAAFAGNLGDGTQRVYASEVRYNELGGREQERFGTATPVYNKSLFNGRGQLAEIRVSTYGILAPGQGTNWNRGAIINHYSASGWGASGGGADNNGNLKRQEVYVPNDDAVSGYFNVVQQYGYDSLNRLTSVEDKPFNGSPDFYQAYSYDRWGNRTINAAGTWMAPAPQFTPVASTNRLAPPAGFTMTYDPAGNLVFDNYTGSGSRAYDAENRMTAAQDYHGQTSSYAYDADGMRVRRRVAGGAEVWQVYGAGGELLAEYASGASPAAPQKEYGYRAGELLVVAEPGDHLWVDDAVPAGASQYGDGDGWNWVAGAPSPSSGATSHQSNVVAGLHQHFFAGATDKLAVAAGEKLFAYVYLDPSNPPSEVMLQWNSDQEGWNHRAYWGADQIGWGANGTGSRRHVGALPAAGQWVRLEVPAGQVGLEDKTLNGMAFTLYGGRATWDRAGKSSPSAGAGTRWLVTDQLGTPRMVVDQSGSLSGVRRHDYLPFGEEVVPDAAWRTTARGYVADTVRGKFTGYERDAETGLDYARARYFASAQGRFSGADPLLASGQAAAPQTWNRYSYALNNPLRFNDPSGMAANDPALDLENPGQSKQQPTQPPNPTPAWIVWGPDTPSTPQERQTLTDAHAEAQRRVQQNTQCANLFGGPSAAMNGLNNMIFVFDRRMAGKPRPQAAVEADKDGEPTGRTLVNPTGALMTPPGATYGFTLLESPGATPSTLTLSGSEAGAFGMLHERGHPAGSFGKTDVDNPELGGGKFDNNLLANNYINNFKVWKACFPDRKPVPNSSKVLPR